jgi:RHS repeat-associated protein
VARYKYDLFNRRVQKLFPAPTPSEEVAWSGWQELEHYRNGQLTSRSVFGSGLDEIVHSQWDLDFDGQLETDFYPVYDHTGNLAALVNQSGRTVASYVYSPFGEELRVLVDEIPPAIQQLRVGPPDLIRFEFDGELWLGALETGIENGEVTVTMAEPPPGEVSTAETSKTAGVKSLSLSATQPILHGREARRRVELTVADPPAPGTEVQLTIARSAVRDLFGNQLAEDLQVTFLWPETDELLVEDAIPPQITEIFLRDDHVEVTLSETPEMTLVPAAFQIDGGTTTWALLEDTYTIRSEQPLSPGPHLLQVDPSNPIDLAGLGVASLFEQELTIDDPPATLADPQKESGQAGDSRIYSLSDPRIVPLTALANRATFHGRPLDVETGLLYFRNRYYDPEMGRFLTTDPMGYADSPSLYQYAGNNPVNFSDPMGLLLRVSGNDRTPLTNFYGEGNVAFNPVSDDLYEVSISEAGLAHIGEYVKRTGGSEGFATSLNAAILSPFWQYDSLAGVQARERKWIGGEFEGKRLIGMPEDMVITSPGNATGTFGTEFGNVPITLWRYTTPGRIQETLDFVFSPEYMLLVLTIMTPVPGDEEVAAGAALGQGGRSGGLLFRGERASRIPELAFRQGFSPKGTGSNLLEHVSTSTARSQFISSSQRMEIAQGFAGRNGYVYVIRSGRGIEVNSVLGARSPFPEQLEVALPGGVRPSEIVGAYRVQGGRVVGDLIPNPGYQP